MRVIPEASPWLSVVIVNYREWEETAALTRQILATPEARRQAVEVVIIDNHSPPHPLTARLRRWPGVSLRRWQRNRGFARAVNEGIRLSRGKWFLLLNPDITLEKGFLKGVLDRVDRLPEQDPRTGIIGFHLRNSDGSLQQSSGPFPTLLGTLLRLLKPRASRKYLLPPMSQTSQVPWVTGCCLLINQDCAAALGGLDESFFLYYEDVDLCRRARALGWSVHYEPGLSAVHHRPLHRRRVSPLLRVCTRHALLVYSWKHWPRWQFRLLAGIIGLEAWLRARWAARQGDTRHEWLFRQLGLIARCMRQGLREAGRRRLNRLIKREEVAAAERPRFEIASPVSAAP
jgi:GT2 family glycosyltransferase